MADDFTERYGDLINGSYDCVDRVVLNAFFSVGHNPGRFRCWWRRLHGSYDQLDDAHLMRTAGRFARRVKAWAAANGVPVIFYKAGERKHLIAEQYLEENSVAPGGVPDPGGQGADQRVEGAPLGARGHHPAGEEAEQACHYSFHIMDRCSGTW